MGVRGQDAGLGKTEARENLNVKQYTQTFLITDINDCLSCKLCCQEVEVICSNILEAKLDHWRKKEGKIPTARVKETWLGDPDIVIKKLSSFSLQILKLQQA